MIRIPSQVNKQMINNNMRMMKMKYIKKLAVEALSLVVLLSTVCFPAFAATTSANIAASSESVNVGDKVTVTFNFSASETIYKVEMKGTYNSSILKFVSSNLSEAVVSGGNITATFGGSSTTSLLSIEFTAISAGDCTLAVSYSELSGLNGELGYPTANKTINVKNSSAMSSNANLSALTISAGTLSPAFNSNVTTYSVTVSNAVTQILVSATTQDTNAKWVVTGDKNMSVGSNSRVVKVTASNGTTKDYIINITREGDANAPIATNDDDILIDGVKYKLVNNLSGVNIPNGFEETTCIINGKENLAFKHKTVNMVLVCLNNESSGNMLFVFDQESNTYSGVLELTFQDKAYIVANDYSSEEIPENYIKKSISIQDLSVNAWQLENSNLSDFYLLYLINQDGEFGLYQYDSVELSMQRYISLPFDDSELVSQEAENENLANRLKTSQIVGGIFIGLSSLLVILLIISAVIFKKNR